MQLVTFCGSAGERSSNQALLDVVGGLAGPLGWRVVQAEGLARIPMFDPAVTDDKAPAAVATLRTSLETADAVALAIPEYGGGAAGWAKNALDWMVGSGSLYGRTTAVLCAGSTGGPNAVGQIARTLTWQGAYVVASLGVAAPSTKRDADGRFVDEATLSAVAELVGPLLEAAGDERLRDRLTIETLAHLGVPRLDRRRA